MRTTLPCLYCRGLRLPRRWAGNRTQLWGKSARESLCELCRRDSGKSFSSLEIFQTEEWMIWEERFDLPFPHTSSWARAWSRHSYKRTASHSCLRPQVHSAKEENTTDFIYTYLQIHRTDSSCGSTSPWSGSSGTLLQHTVTHLENISLADYWTTPLLEGFCTTQGVILIVSRTKLL